MKAIAMYLPQFHQVKENDQWWGEGYTEWTAVKQAKKIINEQQQPKEPLDQNYYNLLDKDTMRWQAKLASEYNVHGFCFYHYYFKEGRKILEKPAENLLAWKDIDINFCFCWANETWARSWSNITYPNTWNVHLEKDKQGTQDNGILLLQEYGREEEWKKHFEYLLPFFQDNRYIKQDGKPIFLIYKPEQIYDLDGMMECFNQLAIENGLLGIYLIVINSDERKWHYAQASLVHEPLYTRGELERENKMILQNGIKCYDYSSVWEKIVQKNRISGERCYYQGTFIDYDDTPRRGEKGSMMINRELEIFQKYLPKLKENLVEKGQDFLFINAWNEWAEGMYLEPDKDHQYQPLAILSQVITSSVEQEKVEQVLSFTKEEKEVRYLQKIEEVNERYQLLNQWLFVREEGINITQYLVKYGYKTVAIYGYGYLGKHLIYDLKQSSLQLQYVIDQKATEIESDDKILGLNEVLPKVDIVIITPFVEYKDIRKKLREKIDFPIISLKEMILEMHQSKIIRKEL